MRYPTTTTETVDPRWKYLCRAGGASALIMLGIMLAQIIIFIAWPPPVTVEGFFVLFQHNWLLGLLSLDLLYIVNNALLILVYLALYIVLKRAGESTALIAAVLGIVGVAAYFASNTAFEMLALSSQYAAAADESQRAVFLGAGQAVYAIYKGTAFDVYYVLNAVALLLFSAVMLRSHIFTRATGCVGLVAGLLMAVPSTAGTLGLIFSLASLVPWAVFSIMIARKLFSIAT